MTTFAPGTFGDFSRTVAEGTMPQMVSGAVAQAPTPPGGGVDPWIQAQQQAQQAAYQQWGPLPSAQSGYQADPGLIPQQNPGGGYNSGEDWVKAQAHAQAQGDQRYGPAPEIGYKGQTGPYAPTSDQPLSANYLTARPDQWAMNGSGPAIAPAMQQAVNEDPRLADLYSSMPVSRLNNIGNGFGVLPGALTPGVMHANGGKMPASFNQLSQRTAQNPGAPPGLQNLGPWVAQQMAANPLQARREGGGLAAGINPSGSYNNQSYYDYSSPTGGTATSAGNQLATQQRGGMSQPSQQQMLSQVLRGGAPGGAGVPTQPQAAAGAGAPMSVAPQGAPASLAQLLQGNAASPMINIRPPAGIPGAPTRSPGTPERALGSRLRQLNGGGLLSLGQAGASPAAAGTVR